MARETLLAARAQAQAAIMAARLKGALLAEATDQAFAGVVDRQALKASLTALSDREVSKGAKRSVSEAYNLGRRHEASKHKISKVIRQSVRDDVTCVHCAGLHGKTWDWSDPEWRDYDPPEDGHCEGKDYCRCVLVFVGEEGVPGALPEEALPPEAEFIPARTIEEAEVFAKEHCIKSGGQVVMKGLDIQNANTINQVVSRAVAKYGFRPDNIVTGVEWKAVGGRRLKRAWAAVGHARGEDYMIFWKRSWAKKGLEELQSALNYSLSTGYHKCSTLSSIIEHEYGHIIMSQRGRAEGMGVFRRNMLSYLDDAGKRTEVLGRYAGKTTDEAWAEAFMMYQEGVLPQEYHSAILSVIGEGGGLP